jgi:DHA1 family multidrug resistance protein-like MFS transporter
MRWVSGRTFRENWHATRGQSVRGMPFDKLRANGLLGRDKQMKTRLSPFVLLCITGGLAIFSSTMAKNPALPLFIRSLGVDESTLGFIAAASTIVGILVSLPAGVLSDIIGRKRVILVAAVVFATAPFLYLLVTAPWQLVLVRVYHGLATAILGPVALAAVADTFEKGRGERMGWYSSATLVGRFLAPFVGGILIFGEDFHWVYLADGFAGVLALVAALRLPLATATSASAWDALKKQRGKYGQEIGFVFRNRGILVTSGVDAAQYFGYGCLETFLQVYLSEKLGFAVWEIGLLFTGQILAATFTKPIMGRLSDRYGRPPLVIAGLAVGGIVVALMLLSSSYLVIMALIAISGLGLATVTASTSALVADLSRSQGRGSSLGVLSGIMDIGHSSGPIVTGILVGAYSYRVAFASVGIILVGVSLVFWLIMGRAGRPADKVLP